MKITDIKIPRNRSRKNLGDIDALAASMNDIGLLQPVVVDSDCVLIAGVRRMAAAKILGWTDIKTTTAKNLEDALQRLKAERDENTCRQNFIPEEAYDMAERIRPLEDKAAEGRKSTSNSERVNFTPSEKGKSGDKTAAAVGMSRPTLGRVGQVVEAARAEPEKYQDALDLMNKTGKVSRAFQMVNRQKKREEALTLSINATSDNYRVFQGDIRQHATFDIMPDSVDAIVTDPPYPEEYLPLYTPFAELAARVLKPGGLCIVMTAHYTLPEVMRMMGEHLDYWWIAAYLMPRSEGRVFSRKALIGWKPLLVYAKDKYTGEWFRDTCQSGAPAKDAKDDHEWGQDEAGLNSILDSFTQNGMTVLDPFCGAGSTGVACLKSGRNFIGIDIDQANVNLTAKKLESIHD